MAASNVRACVNVNIIRSCYAKCHSGHIVVLLTYEFCVVSRPLNNGNDLTEIVPHIYFVERQTVMVTRAEYNLIQRIIQRKSRVLKICYRLVKAAVKTDLRAAIIAATKFLAIVRIMFESH